MKKWGHMFYGTFLFQGMPFKFFTQASDHFVTHYFYNQLSPRTGQQVRGRSKDLLSMLWVSCIERILRPRFFISSSIRNDTQGRSSSM